MTWLIVALLLIGLLSPKSGKPKKQQKKAVRKQQPCYDISLDDMIMYDIFFDD